MIPALCAYIAAIEALSKIFFELHVNCKDIHNTLQ